MPRFSYPSGGYGRLLQSLDFEPVPTGVYVILYQYLKAIKILRIKYANLSVSESYMELAHFYLRTYEEKKSIESSYARPCYFLKRGETKAYEETLEANPAYHLQLTI